MTQLNAYLASTQRVTACLLSPAIAAQVDRNALTASQILLASGPSKIMADELEHVLLDSDEVSQHAPASHAESPLTACLQGILREGSVVVTLRMITLTGRTLTLQKAVQTLLRLTKTCQMTISIVSCKAPLLEQPQSLSQPVCKQQPCRNSLLHRRLLAKVTMPFAWQVKHLRFTCSSILLCTAMLILDPAEVLAQQQKAAANRSPAAANQAASAGLNAALHTKAAPQHVPQMPGHASNMMYRPVASAAPMQPGSNAIGVPGKQAVPNNRAQAMHSIQQLLAFADVRWKETNQTPKRQAARHLVQEVKQACESIDDITN